MTDAKIIGVIGGVALLAVAAVFYEIAVWRECLSDHSWWYCLRILGQS